MRRQTIVLASLLSLCSAWAGAEPSGQALAAAGQERALTEQEAQSLYELGQAYANGTGMVQDDRRAADMYRTAAESGHSGAQVAFGYLFETGKGVGKDLAQALHWYRMAVAQGDTAAQFNLGLMYRNGRGVEQDDAQAYAWMRKSAEGGDAHAALAAPRLRRSLAIRQRVLAAHHPDLRSTLALAGQAGKAAAAP